MKSSPSLSDSLAELSQNPQEILHRLRMERDRRAKAAEQRRIEENAAEIRARCEASHLEFSKEMFPHLEGAGLRVGPHHEVMCKALDRVFSGECKRLIINVPPGYTKSVLAGVMLLARAFALNPRARCIYSSFSEALVKETSGNARDLMKTPEFQALWPRQLRKDTEGKGRWKTIEGGGLLAAPAGGTITGFRAGTMEPGFTGFLIIDDPLKPDDADSDTERPKINKRWHTTFKSRLAHEDVPVIIIMQRLHPDDMSGYLLSGEGGDEWEHLMLPVEIKADEAYPDEFTHGRPIDHGLKPGPLWPAKHTEKHIELLKHDEFVYSAQYAQRPIAPGGAIFREEHLVGWDELPNMVRRVIYADTAQKDKEKSDYTVFACWGLGVDGIAYQIDQIRSKVKAADLKATALTFWRKHKAATTIASGPLTAIKVEDKVSGTQLIQELQREAIPVVAVPRQTDKYMRAQDALPSLNAGLVRFNMKAPWWKECRQELTRFPSVTHDDQVDVTVDAIVDLCGNGKQMWEVV